MRLFQIYYNNETLESLDNGFIPLDNTQPERPDFYEYWPIRTALLNQEFEEEEYLGFFSPRLKEKTNLTFTDIERIVEKSQSEVISFSPCFEEIACYPNSFIQGEVVHPGLLRVAQEIFDDLDVKVNLANLIQDQSRIIYSNYFVAKYRFWKEWLQLTDQIFKISEDSKSTLGDTLNFNAKHRTGANYAMKIFIIERAVSILLETKKINAEIGVDMNNIPVTWPGGEKLFATLMDLDALKGHFVKTKLPAYLQFYEKHRWEILRFLSVDKR